MLFSLSQYIMTVNTGLPSPLKGGGTLGPGALWDIMKVLLYFIRALALNLEGLKLPRGSALLQYVDDL